MTRQRQRHIGLIYPCAVVADPQQSDAAGLDIDVDPRGARIKTVLHGLLDHRGGSFHHFTRGDLIGEARLEESDDAHASGITNVWPT